MTYLISQLWLYLLSAGLLGLLLGWVIWGWMGRRHLADARAEHERQQLALQRRFDSEKSAFEEDVTAAFRTRDEAVKVKASLLGDLEGERKAAAEAKAQVGRLTQVELAARGEFERQLASMQEQVELERSAADEARKAVKGIRADMSRQLQAKQATLNGAETAASTAKREAESARSGLTRLKEETTHAHDAALKAMEQSLNEERRAKAALQAELQQDRRELSEAKDSIDTIRADMAQKFQSQQAALVAAESEAKLQAEASRIEMTRLRARSEPANAPTAKAEILEVRQAMQRTIDEERRAKAAAEADRSRLLGNERDAKAEIERLQSELSAMSRGGQGASHEADRLRREFEEARQHQRGLEAELARLRALLDQREVAGTKTASPKFTTDAPRPASLFDVRPGVVDDLKEVKGIGPVMEGILNENGCYHFKQLANFTKRDIEWISAALGSFPDRIERDDWVRQAQTLYAKKYGQRHDVGAVVRTLETTS